MKILLMRRIILEFEFLRRRAGETGVDIAAGATVEEVRGMFRGMEMGKGAPG